MLLPYACDELLEAIGTFIAKHSRWSPIDQDVVCTVDDSDDLHLKGQRIFGTVRAFDPYTGMLLLHLFDRMTYEGHYAARGLDMLVAVPVIRGQRAPRLLLTCTAVRLVAASSFALQGFDRTIGTGRLALHKKNAPHTTIRGTRPFDR